MILFKSSFFKIFLIYKKEMGYWAFIANAQRHGADSVKKEKCKVFTFHLLNLM